MAKAPKNKRDPLSLGVFGEPIVRPSITLASFLEAGGVENAERIAQDTVDKVMAVKAIGLLEFLGIRLYDEACWEKGFLALAKRYLRGFRVAPPVVGGARHNSTESMKSSPL